MDTDNLRTASAYINNQLLSRGLLRNGQNIEFSRPDRGEGGLEANMGRIMSVVNDLILRRDRDATQRETLTTTLRTLRADSLRQTTDLERLQTKYTEAQRKLGISDSTERSLKLQLKSAENGAKVLREEMVRMKALVQQTRNQCAVEVRKRERVIEGLKKHVGDGRVRGGGKTVGVREITVVGNVGEVSTQQVGGSAMDEGYDLRSETNEFLTELARGLSEENENLAALVRTTVESLRQLSGWEKEGGTDSDMVSVVEMGYENLAGEMDAVIEHVRTLLTNPSFVPLEEVEVREEEIIRLREGWEKMESRWRDAVQMMDGWRKRMARSGQTVNLEELKMGLMLSPLKAKDENEQHQLSTLMEEVEEGDTQADIDAMDESEMAEPVEPDFDELDDSDSSLFEEEPVDEISEEASEEISEQMEEEEPNYTVHTNSSLSPGPPPQLSPLKETSGNRSALSPPPQERGGFSTIIEENTFDLLQLESSPKRQKSAKSTPRHQNPTPSSKLTPPDDEVSLLKTATNTALPPSRRRERSVSPEKSSRSTPRTKAAATPRLLQRTNESRLPRPREQPPMQSPLTMASIAAKLAASEREADAARVRAKIKAARANKAASNGEDKKLMPPPPTPQLQSRDGDGDGDEFDVGTAAKPVEGEATSRKRKARDTGRREKASRRRSTLSPWELESLIMGAGGAASPAKVDS